MAAQERRDYTARKTLAPMPSFLDRRPRSNRLVFAVCTAVVATGIATGIGLALDLQTKPGAQVVYVVFVAAAMSVAGLEAGIVAGLLSFPAFIYFFLNDPRALQVDTAQIVSLFVLGLGEALVCWIIQRERQARALSAGARKVSDALDQAGMAMWEWDVERDRVRWSEDARRRYGLGWQRLETFEQLVERIHPEDRERFRAAVTDALAAKSGFEVEVRTSLTAKGWRWIQLQGSVPRGVRGLRGQRVFGLTRDVSARRRSAERERFLGGVTRALPAATDYDEMLSELARLAVPELGNWCWVDVRADDGSIRNVVTQHSDPAKGELARELRRRFPVEEDDPYGAAAVLASGKSQLYPEISEQFLEEATRSSEELDLYRRLEPCSAIVAPLRARGHTIGALTLIAADTPRRYDEDDLAFVEEAAQLASLMIDNARLHRDEQTAREEAEAAAFRMERLQSLTARLSAAASTVDVAQIIVDESRDVLGARAAWVSVLDEDNDELRVLAANGYREDFIQKYRRIPLSAGLAVSESVRHGQATWVESLEIASDRFPEFTEAVQATGGEALAAVPLTSAERAFGFLALRFDGPRSFAAEQKALISSFVWQCSQSLERARLYEREHEARAAAELHRGELQFLSDVSQMLAGTLDPEQLLDALLSLTVPRLADAVSFFLLEDGHFLRRAASVNIDPAKTELMRELRGVMIDIDADPDAALARVVRTREPVAIPRLDMQLLDALALDETQLRTLESLGMRSWHALPLVAHGEATGVLTLATTGDRAFSERDLDLAREFASRAALALTNAYDYERERQARESAERASERLGHLHRITAALAQAVTTEEVASAIAVEAGAAFGADAAATQLLTEDGSALELATATGHLAELLGRYGRLSTDQQVPAVQAIRSAKVLWFASAEELAARYPDHAQVRRGLEAVGFVPLVGREPLGLLTVSFERRREVSQEDRALIEVLLQQCGQALERARLYEREQEARRHAEDASQRLDQLQTVLEVGLSAESVDDFLRELLRHVRGILHADRAAVLTLDDDEGVLRIRAAEGIGLEIQEVVRVPLGRGIAGRIAVTGEPRIVDDLTQVDVVSDYLRESGGSLIGVPLSVKGRVLGVMHVSSLAPNAFTEDDLELLVLAAERAGLAFERMMMYEREHEIAVTLQQSVLPGQLPEIDRLDVAVRYLPGRNELEVGGDWYDVIELDRSRVGVVVGDVVGKGVIAAAAMAQLRNALRVYALDGLKPSSVLSRLADLARTVGAPFATVAYMVIDTERGTCRYASAGHPPPLHLRPGWPAVFLEGGRSTPIGIGLDTRGRQASVELQPGDLLLLYTDGLVESRTMTLNEGMDRLCEAVETGPDVLDGMLDHIGELLAVDTRQDDVALVALRWLPAPSLALRLLADPASLAEMRRQLRSWLDVGGVEEEEANDILVACSEACANAIVHAVEPVAPEFELIGTRSNGEISVLVRDFGRWREPDPARDSGGYGLKLMEALMDDVQVSTQENGTEVRLRRRLHPMSSNGR
jgi:GAF domain-containing protein/anti-sigma regulatory factor (Ser/Thr protein kinase)/PAS domain-containing protein